jgi:hypothetical protein
LPDPFKVHIPLEIKMILFPVSVGRGSKNENEKNLEILVCAKHAETEKHLTPKSIQPESILPPLIGHCQQLI